MRVLLQPAFVLHRRLYRETSLLLDVFSLDYGRVSLIAKGVRQHRSANRALLQSYRPLLLSWQGKTELMTLTGVEGEGIPFALRGECLLAGFYLNELLMYLLPKQDAHPNLYAIYHHTLMQLQTPTLQQQVLRIFEKRLLEELGYGLQLGGEWLAEDFYQYFPEQGFKRYELQSDEIPWTVFSGKSLLALMTETLDNEGTLKEIKRLMRLAFKPLLIGKTLKSRELFI